MIWRSLALLSVSLTVFGGEHPILPIGSPAPGFSLPGVDGRIHKLSDYSASPVLVVAFNCNHCPIAQMYEQRLQRLSDDYKARGVAVVVIQPNDPRAIRVDELDCADTSDSLEEMKIRVSYKHLTYPYLYDGDTQSVTRAYGPQATPHVFIFDKERKLRYEGRVDNSYREELVATRDARDAVEAILAGKPVAVAHTGVFGCSTKWKEKESARLAAEKKVEAEPVVLKLASAEDLRKLRANPTGKLLLVNFWAASCKPCLRDFGDLQTTFRMYRSRDFELITVSTNIPAEEPTVMKILQKEHASSRNLLFGSDDTAMMRRAFDARFDLAVPYTVLITADGKVVYENRGDMDFLELRRTILAWMPADYIGFQNYWKR